MQFTTALLAALSATSALALPHQRRQDTDNVVQVTLASSAEDVAVGTAFDRVQFGEREERDVNNGRIIFQTVNLRVGKDVLQQDLRCQIVDEAGNPIPVNRGANIGALTFADGGKGEWTLAKEAIVDKIICDPTFISGTASPAPSNNNAPAPAPGKGTSVTVALFGSSELATQTNFLQGGLVREELPPTASSGPYDSVDLVLGDETNPLRCQLIGASGIPINVKRNGKVDTTFADGGVGPWTLVNAKFEPEVAEVEKIVCDSAFKANPIN